MFLQSTSYDRAPEGIIYRDIRQFMRLSFSKIVFSFAPRDCSKVAHALAELGSNGQDLRRLWVETVPNDVNALMASDVCCAS
jgi:hypothetical protein